MQYCRNLVEELSSSILCLLSWKIISDLKIQINAFTLHHIVLSGVGGFKYPAAEDILHLLADQWSCHHCTALCTCHAFYDCPSAKFIFIEFYFVLKISWTLLIMPSPSRNSWMIPRPNQSPRAPPISAQSFAKFKSAYLYSVTSIVSSIEKVNCDLLNAHVSWLIFNPVTWFWLQMNR